MKNNEAFIGNDDDGSVDGGMVPVRETQKMKMNKHKHSLLPS
jgi:hypothetical protein